MIVCYRQFFAPGRPHGFLVTSPKAVAGGTAQPECVQLRTGLGEFIVPIADIEDETGLDFFPSLPRRRQTQLESSKGVLWGHDQKCSGVGGD